jgi:hypothetical protein
MLEKRIAALEAATQDDRLKLVLVEDGQTEAEVLRLAGWPPDAMGLFSATRWTLICKSVTNRECMLSIK